MALFPVILFLVTALLLLSFPVKGDENQEFAALSTALPEVQREIVNKHNELWRAVSPSASDMLKMEWNAAAARNAQAWADQCKYHHSISCGENLFMSSAPSPWSSAIQRWYNESKYFTFNEGPLSPSEPVGHYTQQHNFRIVHGLPLLSCVSIHLEITVNNAKSKSVTFSFYVKRLKDGNNAARRYAPYKQGAPCASCPGHCEDGLCTNGCGYENDYTNCKDLKKTMTCNDPFVNNHCQASCNCEGKIY
ncbi:LOW QUALITY PROTEIN: cysteine-rich secretory protein 3-like [Fukomys damarensis]|uniref:LOW QUALITY PROTEIN: cysteine-rich secretory protein 3-like n=1 Tax=Fukomys damarensis TaxID=885580 RepID=UPI00145529AF|nr:LOW QUALITY PROTEIN: cysteine-rich secretory protein 3-like [Fukomys damarensis]